MLPLCRNVKSLLQVLATWRQYGRETAAVAVTSADLEAVCDMRFPWQEVPTPNGQLPAQRHHALRYRKARAQLDRTVEEAGILANEVVRVFAWLEERMGEVQARCAALDALPAPLDAPEAAACMLVSGGSEAGPSSVMPASGEAQPSAVPPQPSGAPNQPSGPAAQPGATTAQPCTAAAQPGTAPVGANLSAMDVQEVGGVSADGSGGNQEAARRSSTTKEQLLAAGQLALLQRKRAMLSIMCANAERQLRRFMPLLSPVQV